ncbi:MAG TPA: histidine kinase dimerization/phospho-acceptor domain-containing protein, partial [Anaerolineae bacterium]|nr:histidine kinase dimerization/phospho-acceptor domain-containing protein [Anaerolineae bacterium]
GEGRVRDEGRKRHYLDVMIRESQRLTRLVNNVLDFSRLEQGRKTYRPQTVDAGAAVRDMAAAQDERIRQAGLRGHFHAIDHCDTRFLTSCYQAIFRSIDLWSPMARR